VPDGPDAPDGDLVSRARGGDTTAFAALYGRHAGAVRAALRSQLRDGDRVDDLVQEAFARALARIDSLREPDRVRSWLLAIARNLAMDEHRARARTAPMFDDDALDVPSTDPGPSDWAEAAELGSNVVGAMSLLSRRDATALALVHDLGFSPAEVAAALEITPGAAKVAVHRARRRLQQAMEQVATVRAQATARAPADGAHGGPR